MDNKQQTTMKLYTEEQVRKMLEVCIDSDLYEHILTFEDILKTQTPKLLNLPTDIQLFDIHDKLYFGHSIDWVIGAKWMRNKIQGGTNESN